MFENFRKWRRYSISARALIKRRDEGLPKGLIAQVTTISQGGMGFYADVYLEKATRVSVEFLSRAIDEIKKEIVEGSIASVCSQGNDYFMGVAFDREIPYDLFFGFIR